MEVINRKGIATLLIGLTFCVCSGMRQNLSALVVEQDSLALVALYDSTDGINWTHNIGWLSGVVSQWYGITVTSNRVTKVRLDNNNLVGNIPTEIGNLTELTGLLVYQNQITGQIPVEIGNLTKYRIS